MPPGPLISTLPCQVVTRCATARGLDAAGMCEQIGVDLNTVNDPEERVPIDVHYGLLEALADGLAEPHIGLELPQYVDPNEFGLLGFLFMRSANVGAAFERMIRYQRLLSDPELRMHSDGERVQINYELCGPPRPGHDHVGDIFVAETLLGFRLLCGETPVSGLEVQLTRSAVDAAPYQRWLGLVPTFDAPALGVSFDASLFALQVDGAEPALAELLDRQAKLLTDLLPPPAESIGPQSSRVRELLLDLLPNGVPRIEQVAKGLGQSTRSLQRHLHDEDTTLSQIVDDYRRELSQRQLRKGTSITEIALLLGYSEVSAFYRGFKRWTGTSPGRWRESAA